MASDREELGLLPNYDERISVNDVYVDTARAIITTGNVDLLCFSQRREPVANIQESVPQLPSWVPDWRNPIAEPSGQSPWQTSFTASRNKRFETSVGASTCVTSLLELSGWVVDTIEEVSLPWINPDGSNWQNKHNTTKYLAAIRELCKTSDEKSKSTGYDIFSRAADRESAHFLIPIADQEHCSARGRSRAGAGSQEAYSILDNEILIQSILQTKGFEAAMALDLKSSMYVELMRYQKSRRPFLSDSGYVGLAPGSSEKGDVVVIFRGAKFPYVLRRNGDGTYRFLGEAYVHGIMYGEYLECPREEETFVLR